MKCYFFGTFNPVHTGHLEIAQKVKEQFGFDSVIFVPAYCPPHKDITDATFEDRIKMLRLAAGKKNVSDVEYSLPVPSYSYNSVLELKKKDKTQKINVMCGYDAFLGIEKWMKPEILKYNVNFIVIPRRTKTDVEESLKHLKERGWNFKIANIDFIDISSNFVRDCILNEKPVDDLVDKKVKRYIYGHNLYKRETSKMLK